MGIFCTGMAKSYRCLDADLGRSESMKKLQCPRSNIQNQTGLDDLDACVRGSVAETSYSKCAMAEPAVPLPRSSLKMCFRVTSGAKLWIGSTRMMSPFVSCIASVPYCASSYFLLEFSCTVLSLWGAEGRWIVQTKIVRLAAAGQL